MPEIPPEAEGMPGRDVIATRLAASIPWLGEDAAQITTGALVNIETGRRIDGVRRREITIDELDVTGTLRLRLRGLVLPSRPNLP